MWKIEKCYKIIFEAILEQEALKKICTEVGMYILTQVLLLLM